MSRSENLSVARSQGHRHGLPVSRIVLRSFFEARQKTLPKTANAGEKQNESNLDRKFDQKIKAKAIFSEEFSSFGHSTLFVKGTRWMGLPILRVVVLHSHNPDGPQIWHEFYLHWPEWDRPTRSQIEQGSLTPKSGVKLLTGLSNVSHRHSPKMHCA